MPMYRSKGPRRYWPRSRAGGCLLWIVLLIVILIVFSLLFGGFQKGTKVSLGADARAAASLSPPRLAQLRTADLAVRHAATTATY